MHLDMNLSIKTWGRIDILDNNIGIDSRLSVVDETEEYWNSVMDVNLKPIFLLQ